MRDEIAEEFPENLHNLGGELEARQHEQDLNEDEEELELPLKRVQSKLPIATTKSQVTTHP